MNSDYKIEIEAFQGPMDLLLHLIDKAEIDIYDIPINLIAEQFIDYIKHMEELNLDITSEFLIMASTLLEIKSKMLLPQKENLDDLQLEMLELDPRAELVRRLVEYKKYKMVAEELRDIEKIQSKIYYKPKEDLSDYESLDFNLEGLDIDLLVKTISIIIGRRKNQEFILNVSEIQREEYTLEVCTDYIINKLESSDSLKFSSLIDIDSSKNEIITYFLSILELISMKYIIVIQEEDFTDLIISKRDEKEFV